MEETDSRRPAGAGTSGRAVPGGAADADSDGRVPLFGTWRAIHGAVVVCALIVMGLLALFSRWPF